MVMVTMCSTGDGEIDGDDAGHGGSDGDDAGHGGSDGVLFW